MILAGQFGLLAAFVAVGYAVFACLGGVRWQQPTLLRTGRFSAVFGFAALSVVLVMLVIALLTKDFRFQYVAQYTNRTLPWHFSLSSLWVGQAGSLLLWSWMLGLLSLAFQFWPRQQNCRLRDPVFAVLSAYWGFLIATMVFAADPMEANLSTADDGAGLSPLLQHPAMLIHPPLVFLGYALWAVPCAFAIAVLFAGHPDSVSEGTSPSALPQAASQRRPLETDWVRAVRPWALIAWTVLGSGILLGAYWSYEELGWGGYWAWDPVENGSLIPWLIGTAFIHTLMTWQHCGMLKKTSLALAIAAFGMCNFATFLTRSGIFSSLHAFSQSPIGWLFLGLMLALAVGGGLLILRAGDRLKPDGALTSIWTREAFVILSMVALLLLASVTVAGTLSVALSAAFIGRSVMVGPEFYNRVLVPIGMLVLATMAAAPVLRWNSPPDARGKTAFKISAVLATAAVIVVLLCGVRNLLALSVAWLAACAVATHVVPFVLEACNHDPADTWGKRLSRITASRRMYGSFLIHLGIVCIVVGVTGSSLGTRRHDLVMKPGQVVRWAGRSIRYRQLVEQERDDKFIFAADLEVFAAGRPPFRLLPAQHLHRLQNQWTTEVAIDSTWGGDFYTILHHGEGRDEIRLTLVDNPLMRFLWLGGWVIIGSTGLRLWPARRRVRARPQTPSPVPARNRIRKSRRKRARATPELLTLNQTTTNR